MLKLMQRYLAATFIAPFLIGTVFFVSFLLTFELFKVVRLLSDKSTTIFVILELIAHIAISFVPIAVPIAALFATIYTLGRLSEDSEIVAMRSFGVTKSKILMPFLLVAAVISISVFSLNRSVIPYSKTKFKEILMRLTSKGVLSDVTPETFYTEIPGVILFAEKVENNGAILRNLFINQKVGKGERTIIAKRGALIKQSTGEWSIPTVRMHLNDGNVVTYDENGDSEKILFEEYDFPIMSQASRMGFVTKDSMRSNDQLLKKIKSKKEAIEIEKKKEAPNKGLIRGMVKSLAKTEIEFWSRYNTPIQSMMFVFLGVSLGVKRRRGRAGNTSAIGMSVLFAYYIIFFMGMTLAKSGHIPSFLVVFIPTTLVFIAGVKLYQRLDWAS